jgi:hypothetical protein
MLARPCRHDGRAAVGNLDSFSRKIAAPVAENYNQDKDGACSNRGGVSMRLSLKALAVTSAIIWGGCVLGVGLVNLAAPTYGTAFLQMASSIYPGFHNSRSLVDVLVGTGYGVVDGGFGGLIFGWVYNLIAARGA